NSGAHTVLPVWWHAPPLRGGASQRDTGDPPRTSMRSSLPCAKNPMLRLSADQKGKLAPSVSAKGCAFSASRARSHSLVVPKEAAAKAIKRPLGEITGGPAVSPANSIVDGSGGSRNATMGARFSSEK